jgi:hemerythrin
MNAMSLIQWGVDFYTGLPDIDEQHRRLVALANRLADTPRSDADVLARAFEELRTYVIEHFSLEEKQMTEAQIDPEHLQYHMNAHALFAAKVTDLWGAYGRGADGTFEELLGFLKTWILQHILHTDRVMALRIHEKLGVNAPHNMFTHF